MTIPTSAVAVAFIVTVCLIAFLLVWDDCRLRYLNRLRRKRAAHDRELCRETARHCEKIGKAA